jgi:hypothetical protein
VINADQALASPSLDFILLIMTLVRGNHPVMPVLATVSPLKMTLALPNGPSFISTSMPSSSVSFFATRAACIPENQYLHLLMTMLPFIGVPFALAEITRNFI